MGTANPHLHLPFPFPLPCKQKLILTAIYLLIIPLSLLNLYVFFLSPHPRDSPPPNRNTSFLSQEPVAQSITSKPQAAAAAGRPCDLTDGRWVPDPRPPRYNDTSCTTIKFGQNCMSHGRPDTGYLYWRWKPAGCELNPFSAAAFLDLLVNKHLAFVGDSLARNQLESLLCLLTAATPAELVYNRGEENKFRRWFFRPQNASISVYWSPFLVKGIEKSAAEGRAHNQLFVDLADENWAAELGEMDVVVFSAGHWFLIPGIFYGGKGEVVGCHHCRDLVNMTETGFFDAFRGAVRTAVRAAVGRMGKGRLAVVATFTPAHFEGEWDNLGACARKEPFGEGEKEMEYMDKEMRKIEMEEVAAAAAAAAAEIGGESGGGGGGGEGKVKLEVLDVTRMAMMRPDGHPGPYMHPNPFEGGVKERVQNDCLHWCLPGPIDTWNEILLEMLRRWRWGGLD